jgi:hypothetical protein
LDPNPQLDGDSIVSQDQGEAKRSKRKAKSAEISCFEVLDVLFGGWWLSYSLKVFIKV